MGFLDEVKSGVQKEPMFALIYGVPGIGKSTLASEFPEPLFFGDQLESSKLNVARGPEPKTMDECRKYLQEILDAKVLKFKTLVLDNLGWFEPLPWAEICKKENVKSIDDIGWQNGYKMAVSRHQEVAELLKAIRKKQKVDVIVLGHSRVKNFADPSISSNYDKYQLSINEQAENVWVRMVEAVLFMNYEILKADEKKKFAQGEGIRYMYTQERPAFKAKNRYGLPFKILMPKGESYKTLMAAIENQTPESGVDILKQIGEMIPFVKNAELIPKINAAVEKAGYDPEKLTPIKQRLLELTKG